MCLTYSWNTPLIFQCEWEEIRFFSAERYGAWTHPGGTWRSQGDVHLNLTLSVGVITASHSRQCALKGGRPVLADWVPPAALPFCCLRLGGDWGRFFTADPQLRLLIRQRAQGLELTKGKLGTEVCNRWSVAASLRGMSSVGWMTRPHICPRSDNGREAALPPFLNQEDSCLLGFFLKVNFVPSQFHTFALTYFASSPPRPHHLWFFFPTLPAPPHSWKSLSCFLPRGWLVSHGVYSGLCVRSWVWLCVLWSNPR